MKTSLKCFIPHIIGILAFANIMICQGIDNDGSKYTKTSVLSSGNWKKLEVKENAIYKLTYEQIQAMGIDPVNAKIYGYGGWILDEYFSNYIDDLPPVPVWISGNDNKLDPGEFMLFYGKGIVKWT